MYGLQNQFLVPGLSSQYDTLTKDVMWGKMEWSYFTTALVSGAARDSGNTPTTLLRPGLLLGIITSSKKWVQWDATATDGSQNIAGVLCADVSAQLLGSNADRFMGFIAIRGGLKAASLLRYGNSSYGISGDAYELVIRKQLAKNFILDDKPHHAGYGWARTRIYSGTSLTVDATDNDTLFVMYGGSGAVAVTLPTTMLAGMRFGFYNAQNQNLTISTGTADKMVVFNDAAADSVALDTANEKIGGMFEFLGTSDNLALCIPHLWEGQTMTIVS